MVRCSRIGGSSTGWRSSVGQVGSGDSCDAEVRVIGGMARCAGSGLIGDLNFGNESVERLSDMFWLVLETEWEVAPCQLVVDADRRCACCSG